MQKEPKTSAAEKDFLQAIKRLQSGRPTHPELVVAAESGKLRISATTVAKEACRSRTLISHAGCALPHIRDIIIGLKEQPKPSKPSALVIADLRKETASLRNQLSLARSENAALLRRLERVEAQAKKTLQQAERMVAKANSKQGAGTSMTSNVVQLITPDRDRDR